MSSKKSKIFMPLLLLGAALLIAFYMISQHPETATVETESRAISVSVAQVTKQNLRIPIQAQGTVSAHRETTIVAEVGGKVIEVSPSFYAGGYVAKGDLLLRIDDVEHQAKFTRAQAAVVSAESILAQEQGRADVAKQEFLKFPNKKRSATAEDLYLRKPQLKQTQSQLLSAQADLRKAAHDLQRTVLRAPYDALIKEKSSDLGSYLSPGTPVTTLYATDFAEVRLAVPQSKLPYLELPSDSAYEENKAAQVNLYSNVVGNIQHWKATLHHTEGVYDERSRVLFTVARIPDPYMMHSRASRQPLLQAQGTAKSKTEYLSTETNNPVNSEEDATAQHKTPLRIGTFVNAVILSREIQDLIVLPREILRAGGYLWVVDADDKLRNRQVETLITQGKLIYVTAGLEDNDRVCLTVLNGAIAGSSVEIAETKSTFQPTDSTSVEPVIAQENDTEATQTNKPASSLENRNMSNPTGGSI